MLQFYVVEFACENILGLSSIEKLHLVKRVESVNTCAVSHELLSDFTDLFDGTVGCVSKQFEIQMKENAVPVVTAARRVPFALHDKLKSKLVELEKSNIIAKVENPTDWVSPIVIVQKKNGDLRLCLDPKSLNDNMMRSHYQLPTGDEVASKLCNAKYFSVLDANAGFWMVPLEEKSSYLCTFATPFGRYRFLRLPFGIKCAPEAFHRIVKHTFDDLPGVDSYIDDILVWGSTKSEHDERLRNVLLRARERGFKFNPDKCQICVNEIKYLGTVFSSEGIKIDDRKVEAIVKLPAPTCRKDLERFLGMLNYVAKFIPGFADKTAQLRSLLKKDSIWQWDENCDKSFSELKDVLCKSPVLGYFDSSQPVTLSVDASSVGLGAAILQNGKPVAYASRALTQTQQGYAQIEKEMLAITFGCERFHSYLYSRPVLVESDNKPLE